MIAVVSGQYLMAAVFVGVSLLMRDDNFSRNRAIGIRTKHTLSSDEAWRRGHRAGWPWVLSAGIAAAVTGTAGLSISLATRGVSEAVIGILALVGFGAVLLLVVLSGVVANRAAASSN